ncbi:MAG: hypothetical protein ACE5FA_02215, partial [Dehalococcoidia bacterium]
ETPEPTTPPPTETPEPTPTALPETSTPEPSPTPTVLPVEFPPTGGQPLSDDNAALGLLLLMGGLLVAGGAWMAWRNQRPVS